MRQSVTFWESQACRPERRAWPTILLGLVLSALAGLTGCGEPSFFISIDGLPADTARVRVSTTLNGQPLKDTYTDTNPRLVVRLPTGADGRVKIQITALDTNDCLLSRGDLDESVPGGLNHAIQRALTLALLTPTLCTLSFGVSAEKGLAATVKLRSGLTCSSTAGNSCSEDLPIGTTVTLTTESQGSGFVNWGVGCTIGATCTVQMTRSRTIQANFQRYLPAGKSGWLWQHPLPQGHNLSSIWGSGVNDVWVTTESAILHWDGATWSEPIGGTFFRVWGSGPGDVWAVGLGGTAIHLKDGTWSATDTKTNENLFGLWGSAANDVWAGGSGGTFIHWDGSQWSSIASGTSNTIERIWGSSSTDIWFSTSIFFTEPDLFHFDGKNKPEPTPISSSAARIDDIWGLGSDGIWVTSFDGGSHGIYHWNGTTWALDDKAGDARFIWGLSKNDIWTSDGTSISHWDGQTWRKMDVDASVTSFWGSGPGDVWAIGFTGTILHYDGKVWTTISESFSTDKLNSLSGSGPSDVWGVGERGTSLHWDGNQWNAVDTGTLSKLTSVTASGPKNAWAVGAGGTIIHWNGARWLPVASGTTQDLIGVSGDASCAIAVSVFGTILKWEYTSLAIKALDLHRYIASIATVAPSVCNSREVKTVANDGVIMFSVPGASGPFMPFPLSTDYDLHGISSGFAVGSGGNILRVDSSGYKYTLMNPAITTADLYDVWVTDSQDNGWAVGLAGTLVHWDGKNWSVVPNFTSRSFNAVWGSATNDIWVAGDSGAILYHPNQ